MENERRFLVARYRHRIVIREIKPESCSFSFNRRDAWEHAKQQAKAHPRSQNPFVRQAATTAQFISLDMVTTNLNVADFLPREAPVQTQIDDTPKPKPVKAEPATDLQKFLA